MIIGGGWAGLGAAHALTSCPENRAAYEVTLIEAAPTVGGLVATVADAQAGARRTAELGVHGFWRVYRNIFHLVEQELGIRDAFTDYVRSAQYSPRGLEVESPVFGDLAPLPAPLGTWAYTPFRRLPLRDRLSALPLLQSLIEFDHSAAAWRKYDRMTARELFLAHGCTERLIRDALEPMLLVGLFAPAERCSASATLGMLDYFILAHQGNFDVKWVRGTTGRRIFAPWLQRLTDAEHGLTLRTGTRLVDVALGDDGCGVRHVRLRDTATNSESWMETDAVIFAVGISGAQGIVRSSPTLARASRQFRHFMHLGAVDVLAVRLFFDRRFRIPRKSNALFGFDAATGGTFFDLNALHDDEFGDAPGQVVEVDFYGASSLLVLDDDSVAQHGVHILRGCLGAALDGVALTDAVVVRVPRGVTHFQPGSYAWFPGVRATDRSLAPNVYFAGDWIDSRHGSFSQEKAYVTGIEAANALIADRKRGTRRRVLPVEPPETHIQWMRSVRDRLAGR